MRLCILGSIALAGCDDPPPVDAESPPTEPLTVGLDEDGDGHVLPRDCDDGDADIHPGADEWCNTIDDDCDALIDEDAVDGDVGFVDADGDGVGNGALPLVSCTVPGWAPVPGDCDDGDHARSPLLPD